jgi:hypothetical protein
LRCILVVSGVLYVILHYLRMNQMKDIVIDANRIFVHLRMTEVLFINQNCIRMIDHVIM